MLTTNIDTLRPKINITEDGKELFFYDKTLLDRNNYRERSQYAKVRWELREQGCWVASIGEMDVYRKETAAMPTIHERYAMLGIAININEFQAKTGRAVIGISSAVLDVSTCHISELDSKNISKSKAVIAYDKLGYGWFVYCGYTEFNIDAKIAEIEAEGLLSEYFCDIIRRGCLMGCKWVELDRDGHIWNGLLDVYEW